MARSMTSARDTGPEYEAGRSLGITIEIPYDGCIDTPVLHKPVCVKPVFAAADVTAGHLTGTAISLHAGADTTRSFVVTDVSPGAIFYHRVYNMSVWSSTYATISFGDRVYYDDSPGMPSGCYLSLAASNVSGYRNAFFGFAVWSQLDIPNPFQGDRDIYPLAAADATSVSLAVPILQVGCGGK